MSFSIDSWCWDGTGIGLAASFLKVKQRNRQGLGLSLFYPSLKNFTYNLYFQKGTALLPSLMSGIIISRDCGESVSSSPETFPESDLVFAEPRQTRSEIRGVEAGVQLHETTFNQSPPF